MLTLLLLLLRLLRLPVPAVRPDADTRMCGDVGTVVNWEDDATASCTESSGNGQRDADCDAQCVANYQAGTQEMCACQQGCAAARSGQNFESCQNGCSSRQDPLPATCNAEGSGRSDWCTTPAGSRGPTVSSGRPWGAAWSRSAASCAAPANNTAPSPPGKPSTCCSYELPDHKCSSKPGYSTVSCKTASDCGKKVQEPLSGCTCEGKEVQCVHGICTNPDAHTPGGGDL